jgi:hypothetical protein
VLGQNLWAAQSLQWLGEIAEVRGDARLAGEYFFDAADLWRQLAGDETVEYADGRIDLARMYVELGMLDESEETLGAIVAAERVREHPRPRLLIEALEALEALRDLYVAMERVSEAEELEAWIAELEPRR